MIGEERYPSARWHRMMGREEQEERCRTESFAARGRIARIGRAVESLGAYEYSFSELKRIFWFLPYLELQDLLCYRFREDKEGYRLRIEEEPFFQHIGPVEVAVWEALRKEDRSVAFRHILEVVTAKLRRVDRCEPPQSLFRGVLAIIRCWSRRGVLERTGASQRVVKYRLTVNAGEPPKFAAH